MNQVDQRFWDAMAPDWQKLREQDQLWRLCPQQPELAFDGGSLAMIHHFVGELQDQQACVVGR